MKHYESPAFSLEKFRVDMAIAADTSAIDDFDNGQDGNELEW